MFASNIFLGSVSDAFTGCNSSRTKFNYQQRLFVHYILIDLFTFLDNNIFHAVVIIIFLTSTIKNEIQ